MAGDVVCAGSRQFIAVVLAGVCEVALVGDVLELFLLLGPVHGDGVVVGRGAVAFLLLDGDFVEVGVLLCASALEGVLGVPGVLVVGLGWVGKGVLAGPGEQLFLISLSR